MRKNDKLAKTGTVQQLQGRSEARSSSAHREVFQLQRAVGNRAVMQLLRGRESADASHPTGDGKDTGSNEAPIQRMKMYHGTDKPTATKLLKAKIKAVGTGELGGGFYMTHDLHQAAHIADYYCGKEGRGDEWAVLEFDIDDEELAKIMPTIVSPEEFEDYYNTIKDKGNDIESEHDWTVGPIKDKKTPYIQHLFAQGGLGILNMDSTSRSIVLEGAVGTDKGKYANEVEGYDPNEDEILDSILERGGEEEDEEEDEEEGVEGDEVAETLGEIEELAKKYESGIDKVKKALTRKIQDALEEEEEALTAGVNKLASKYPKMKDLM